MKELFQTIESLQTLPGWCSNEKACTLASMVLALRPALTLEIGVFGGRSFLPMALAHKAIKTGICVGIDAWDKDVAVREQTTNEDREWWAKVDQHQIYANFMQQIYNHDLDKIVQIYRVESRNFQPPNQISVLHIDGSHTQTATTDMVRFGPKVVMGGFLVTDDTDWKGGGVAAGEQRLVQFGFKKLYGLGTGAVFQKIK